MIYGSAFTGIGGFDRGLDAAGMRCAWQIERDQDCQRVLRRHWPAVTRFDDVCEVRGAELPAIDLLCGGFPCQDLSVAGKRVGLAGQRSGLFYQFMRLAAECAPRWILVENVPGLLSSNGGRDMGAVVGELAKLGYGWAYRVLDAQFLGVAQRRRRVFIVGCLGDAARAAQVLFEPESLPGHPAPRREAGANVTTAPTQRIGISGADTTDAQRGKLVAGARSAHQPRYNGTDEALIIANAVTASAGHHGHSSPRGDGSDNLVVAFTNRGMESGDLAETLRAGSHGALPMPWAAPGVRRLTPRECERLQGFPDDWTAYDADGYPISDSARYRMLGNAICCPVSEWIAQRIVAAEEARP